LQKYKKFENQEIVRTSLKFNNELKFKNSCESLTVNGPNDQSKNFLNKINLLKVPQLSTETILKDMNSQFTLITRRAHYNKKKTYLKDSQDEKKENPISFDTMPNYDWDSEKEEAFKSNRKSAKNLYNEEVKCSNFLSIAFLPLVQETYINEKRKMHRNNKLIKYAEGEWLSMEELKFLADTSSLMNKCVDKKFLQDAINIIDPEIIENLELLLSENIIMNYENLRETIKKARLEYIKNLNSLKHEKIQEKAAELMKKEELQLRMKEKKKFKKTLENICLKMEKQGKFYRKPKEQKQVFANMFIQTLKSRISRRKSLENSEAAQQLKFALMSKPTSNSSRKLDIKRRKYHPASKIFLQEKISQLEKDEEALLVEMNTEKTNKKEISKFSLNLHSPIYCRDSQNFKKFYSGGPMVPMRTEPFWTPYDPKKPIICNSANELKKIITLQKYMRKFLAKLKVQNLKEEPHKKVRETLRRLNKNAKGGATKFFETVQHITGFTSKINQPEVKSATLVMKSAFIHQRINTNNDSNKNNMNINNANPLQEIKSSPYFSPSITPIIPKQGFVPFNSIKTPTNLNTQASSTDNKNQKFYMNKTASLLYPGLHKYQPKISSFVSSITKSTQNSVGSQDFNKKTPSETSQVGGLLKHRKLMENAKIGTLTNLRSLGFSFSRGDVNFKDEYNNTALFYVAERGLFDFCDFLLRLGANPNERCSERNTAVHMAFKNGKMDVISAILKHGGDLSLRNKQGDSPRRFGNGRVLKELDLKMMVSFIP